MANSFSNIPYSEKSYRYIFEVKFETGQLYYEMSDSKDYHFMLSRMINSSGHVNFVLSELALTGHAFIINCIATVHESVAANVLSCIINATEKHKLLNKITSNADDALSKINEIQKLSEPKVCNVPINTTESKHIQRLSDCKYFIIEGKIYSRIKAACTAANCEKDELLRLINSAEITDYAAAYTAKEAKQLAKTTCHTIDARNEKYIAIYINGERYPTISEASKATNIPVTKLYKLLKKPTTDWHYIYK